MEVLVVWLLTFEHALMGKVGFPPSIINCSVKLILCNSLQPVAAKPVALQQTMEAMGVRGLTVQNIKSHLQVFHPQLKASLPLLF